MKFKCLSSSSLKFIALLTMVIDHCGLVLYYWLAHFHNYPEALYTAMRYIGRISFPIYCFLLAEGFVHTKSVKRYALSVLAFAFISEMPFDYMLRYTPFTLECQNVMFTLFLGICAMYCAKMVKAGKYIYLPLGIIPLLLAHFGNTDYGAWGVCLILLFYLLREYPFFMGGATAAILFTKHIASAFAILPIMMYNGQRGKIRLKYFFYAFYPVHIIILCIIRYFIFGF